MFEARRTIASNRMARNVWSSCYSFRGGAAGEGKEDASRSGVHGEGLDSMDERRGVQQRASPMDPPS